MTTPADVADATAKPLPPQTTMHAIHWANHLAYALNARSTALPTRTWDVEAVTGDTEDNQAARCYLREYSSRSTAGRAKRRMTAQLFVTRWADNGGTMRVSCPDDPRIGELRYPDRFDILDNDRSWESRAINVAASLLRPAREARAELMKPPVPVFRPEEPASSEAIAQAVSGARPSFAAVPAPFPVAEQFKPAGTGPAPQETLATKLRALADELGDHVKRDDAVATQFRSSRPSSAAFAAHFEGRAEGFAYVIKRMLALLGESADKGAV